MDETEIKRVLDDYHADIVRIATNYATLVGVLVGIAVGKWVL